MASGQGLNRLKQGVVRQLTSSEIARGYLFISKDVLVQDIANQKGFEIKVFNEAKNTNIDKHGRINIGKSQAASIGSRPINIRLDDRTNALTVELASG